MENIPKHAVFGKICLCNLERDHKVVKNKLNNIEKNRKES